MLPPLPRCSGRAYSSLKNRPSVSAFPDSTIGSACTSSFSRFAQRLLTLRPAHSRGHQIRDRYPGLQTFRLLHACPGCVRLERSPGGPCTHWKTPPSHGAHGKRSFDLRQETVLRRQRKEDGLRRRPSVVGVFGTVSQLAAPESVGTGLRKANGQSAPARAKSAAAAICASNRAPRSGSSIPSA